MRILVITPYFYPHVGGTERYIEELYSEVCRQNPEIQVDVLTYTKSGHPRVESYKGLTIYRVKCWELLKDQFCLPNPIQLIRELKHLRSNSYDIVNPHTRFFDVSWWSWIVSRWYGSKAVLTDHCASHPQHANIIVQWIAGAVDTLALKILPNLYDQITVISEATKLFWTSNGTSKTVTVIPNGISHINQELNSVKDTAVKVAFVGRMIASKNPNLVIQAYQTLRKKYSHIQLHMIGGGEQLQKLKDTSEDNVTFTGQITNQELRKKLLSIDILLHPSIHHEGLPTAILEAGISGCAVVATDRGGVTEVIKDRKTGIIIEPTAESIQNAVEELINNPQLRQTLGNNLKLLVSKNYTWPVIAQTYQQFLTKAL